MKKCTNCRKWNGNDCGDPTELAGKSEIQKFNKALKFMKFNWDEKSPDFFTLLPESYHEVAKRCPFYE